MLGGGATAGTGSAGGGLWAVTNLLMSARAAAGGTGPNTPVRAGTL
jgi:hypothetical protein